MNYTKFELKNGLKVIFHQDKSTPVAALNLIYNVGSKDENPNKTGYAHLMEHLMFEGSANISDFDTTLEKVGGTNNAFTNNDYTNYYLILPKNNIETALWLESDRMLQPLFDPERFENQKKVVIEEFKQVLLNEPYGDDMALISDLAYIKHPYRWTTIGKDISHIQKATLDDIKNFHSQHYAPNNAILSVGGDFDLDYIKKLIEKWFEDIPAKNIKKRNIPSEPEQTERREKTVYRNVPFDTIYMAFHMGGRTSEDYYLLDIVTDILDRGKSSRLYQNLVKKEHIFDDIDAYITSNIDNGLVVISGRPAENVSMKNAENAIWKQFDNLKTEFVEQKELTKTLSSLEFGVEYLKTNIMTKTRLLGYYELLGNIDLINTEKDKYENVNEKQIKLAAQRIFQAQKVSVLYYLKAQKK